MRFSLLLLTILFCFSCKNDSTASLNLSENKRDTAEATPFVPTTEAEKIAYANGYAQWEAVKQLNFTFNVERGDNIVAARSWSWKPQSGEVTMASSNDTISYNRSSIDSTAQAADRGFINDKFWLLAPYQLIWDEGTTITTVENAPSPIAGTPLKKLTITYGNDGGYTPGDAYDFYYGNDYIVKEWVFRKGNIEEPSMITTFDEYRTYNGITVATSHTNKEGNFRLFFTDIEVIN